MHKILVIDDDLYICTLLEKYLKKEGFDVETAFTGKSALNKIKTDNFDVVLCDFRLPDYDGKQLLAEIKTININYLNIKLPTKFNSKQFGCKISLKS